MNIDEQYANRFSANEYKHENLRPTSLQGYDSIYNSSSHNQQDLQKNMRSNRLGVIMTEDLIGDGDFDDDDFNLNKNRNQHL